MNTLFVSSYPYVALSANYPHDRHVSFNPYFQQYDNGYYMFKHDIFKSVNDVSLNKYTGFYITDKFKQNQVVSDNPLSQEELFLETLLNLYTNAPTNFISVDDDSGILYSDKFQASDSAVFQLVQNDDGTISFYYNKNYLIVSEATSPWRLYAFNISNGLPAEEGSYKFNFIKHNGNYLIYTTFGSTGVRTRYLKASKNEGFVGFFGTSLGDESIQIGFNFLNFNYVPSMWLKGMDEKSWFYSYFNRPIDFLRNLNTSPNFLNSTSGVEHNFLVSIPYEAKISDSAKPDSLGGNVNVSTMDIDIMGLKNVKNPDYQYSKLPYNLEADDDYDEIDDSDYESEVNKRDYRKIFTGTNQEYGYEMPLLLYSTNNKAITLKKDNTTFFHYPSTAQTVGINQSGLKEAGAHPSTIPFFADKVFKKDANYGQFTNWGESSQLKNGQWLCSWLSGDNDNCVWVDRWYNPETIGVFSALTAEFPAELVCGNRTASEQGLQVVDLPSILTFEAECLYKYFHVGEKFIDYAVEEIIDYGGRHQKIHYDNWTVSSIADETGNGNTGYFEGFDESSFSRELNGTEDLVAVLNGENQYIYIPYSNTFKTSGSNSFSIWAHSEEWSATPNCDIISNGENNYYNLRVSNGLETPISVLFAGDTGKLMLFNEEQKAYGFVSLPSSTALPKVSSLCLDSDLNIWALDDANNILYKIAYNGIIETKVEFPVSYLLSNLVLDSNNSVYVMDRNTGGLSSFDVNGDLLTAIDTGYVGTNYQIQLNSKDEISAEESTKFMFDNKDYPWILSEDRKSLMRYTAAVLKAETQIDDFAIDSNSNIWVLLDGNKIYKLDSVGNYMLSAAVPIKNLNAPLGNLGLVNSFYPRTRRNENFVLVNKNNYIYKYDSNLIYQRKYNLSIVPYENSYSGFLSDWTGYDVKRKFTHNVHFEGEVNLQLSYSLFTVGAGVQKYNMYIPIGRLASGWHHFSGVFDRDSSKVQFFVDGVLENREVETIQGSDIYQKLKNSMILGARMGFINDFNRELMLNSKYLFKGKLDDFRVYSKALSPLEVQTLYKSKQEFFDLNWHIPTGTQYYVEEIQKFFKHKMPGSKSNHYNINLVGMNLDDLGIREQIENIIKATVSKVAPAHAQLYKINWL